jgi:hypothetical protein
MNDFRRIVSSLRDSYINLRLPGTSVPGYRLYRPYGTAGAEEAAEKRNKEGRPFPQWLKPPSSWAICRRAEAVSFLR